MFAIITKTEKPISGKRIVFISQNIFGFRCLKTLLYKQFNVVGVVTRRTEGTISDFCDGFVGHCNLFRIPCHLTDDVNSDETFHTIQEMKPDAILVMGWSQMLKPRFVQWLAPMILGTHPSLLPKNRGRAAITWQILNNEKESGVLLFEIPKTDSPPDSGKIYAQEKFNVAPDETAFTFYDKACVAAEKIIETKLSQILEKRIIGTRQNEKYATYLAKRTPAESEVDWSKDDVYIETFLRAMTIPYPDAFTIHKGEKVIVPPQPIEEIKKLKKKYQGAENEDINYR